MTALKKEEDSVVDGKICEECGNLNQKGRFTCAACGAKLTGGKVDVAKGKDDPADRKDKREDRKTKVPEQKAEVDDSKKKAEAAKSEPVKRTRKPRVSKPVVQTRHNVRFRNQTVLVVSCSCGWAKTFGPDKSATELALAIESHKK